MNKTIEKQILAKLEEQLGKSLTNTKPLVITNTTLNTNVNGMAIYAISDTTFTTLSNTSEGDTLVGQTLLAGNIWYLPIKGDVELATGAVIVYQHDNSGN